MRTVIHQQVVWIPESKQVPFEGQNKDYRLWTLLGATDPEAKPQLPFVPVHNGNAFLEDAVHDWDIRKGTLKYYSRIWGGGIWVLIETLQKVGSVSRGQG